MKLTKIAAALVALALAIPMLPSCGKTEEVKLTNVFKETIHQLPEPYASDENFYINQLYPAGEQIWATCSTYNNETYESRTFFLPIAHDGSFGEEVEIEIENPDNTYLQSMQFTDDGGLWVILESYIYDSETGMGSQSYTIRRYESLESGVFTEIPLELDPEEDANFYINYMSPLGDGSLLVGSWDDIRVLTPDGELRKLELDLPEENVNFEMLVRIKGVTYIGIANYGGSNYSVDFHPFDEATGTLGDPIDVDSSYIYNMVAGPGYDYYYRDNVGVWGVNFGFEKVEVLNFINSDINSNNINQVIPLSADKFITTAYDPETYRPMLAVYDRIPDDMVANKEIITLAVARLNYNLRNDIITFNKSSDTYRIVVNDYSIYRTDEDYNAGTTRLNQDIVSGKVPDILLVDETMQYDSFVAKGLFADLYELMDADPDFDRSLYLENIFEAYETDGKLYSLVPTFYLETFAARTDILEGVTNWSIDEFMQFVKEHPDLQIFDNGFNRESFLQQIMLFSRDSFVDRETGECHFDSPEFRGLLEFASTLGEEDFWADFDYDEAGPDFWQEYENRFAEGSVLLSSVYVSNLVDSYKSMLNYTFKGEFDFIGFPSEEGNGATISAQAEYAISRRSKVKEGAWEFLKQFLAEEEQLPVKTQWGYWQYPNGLPILKEGIEKQLEIAMTPPEDDDSYSGGVMTMPAVPRDETAAVETAAPTVSDDIAVELPVEYEDPYSRPLTEEQAAKLQNLVEGATQVRRQDTDLDGIIAEEAGAYFSGQKSIDEVVGIIQNRAEIYIAESR